MLLLSSDFGDWGICEAPLARREDRPKPKGWASIPSLSFSRVVEKPWEPEEIPAWRSAAWSDLEPTLRAEWCRTHKGWDRFGTLVLHPDDRLLIQAAIMVWNGEMPDGPEEASPRAAKWESLHTWWVLWLPHHLTPAAVRALITAAPHIY